MVDNTSNPSREREEVGRKAGAGATGSTMQREGTAGQKAKEGWNDFRQKVRGKWNQLTDRDLDEYQDRSRGELVNFIGERVGGDRIAIGRDVDTYARETNYRWNP